MAADKVGLAVYNAGTDVLVVDKQGGLGLSCGGAVQRDIFVLRELRSRGIPTLMLPSGGYSDDSHRALGGRVIEAIREFSI